jgi:hypothetical protein
MDHELEQFHNSNAALDNMIGELRTKVTAHFETVIFSNSLAYEVYGEEIAILTASYYRYTQQYDHGHASSLCICIPHTYVHTLLWSTVSVNRFIILIAQ